MDTMHKEICLFGIYDPEYSRNRVLKKGFEECGYRVTECHSDPKIFPGIRKYSELIRHARALQRNKQQGTRQFSYVIVCFPGHSVMWLAAVLFPKERIVFDAFVSLYDSNVSDRKKYGPGSIGAIRDWLLDWYSTHLAWKVLLDTNAHRDYFVKTFGVSRTKCIRVFVGSNEKIFYSHVLGDSLADEPFRVHFHGTYIPLQGIPYIIGAARLLQGKSIRFKIIGSSSRNPYTREIREESKDLVAEGIVEFVDAMPLASLAAEMSAAHVCLGIFGDTAKAQRVIPNKVYEALAMGKPIITADTPAARELLSEKTAVLIPAASAEALAAGIQELRDDPSKAERLGQAALALFRDTLMPKQLVAELLEKMEFPA